MVQQLDQDPVGISKVKGPGPVAMRSNGFDQLNTLRLDPSGDIVHVFGSRDNESNVVQGLRAVGFSAFRQLVNGEIVASACQVNIVRVGCPLDSHPDDRAVESDRLLDVPYVESNVPKT